MRLRPVGGAVIDGAIKIAQEIHEQRAVLWPDRSNEVVLVNIC